MFKFLKSLFNPKEEISKSEVWPFPTSKPAGINETKVAEPVAPYKIEPPIKVTAVSQPKETKPKQVNKPKVNKPKQSKPAVDKNAPSKNKKTEVKVAKPKMAKTKPTTSKKPPKVSS